MDGIPEDRRKRAGAVIREARLEKGWTAVKLADELTAALRREATRPGRAHTAGQSTVSRWETGRAAPEPWKLPVIEELLAIPSGTLATALYDRPPSVDRVTALESRFDRLERSLEELIELLRDLVRRSPDMPPGGDEAE